MGQREIGKSLVFCVSQQHASRITQILNQLAHHKWPGRYSSDFAAQITSNIDEAGVKAQHFSNNKLNGYSRVLEGYKTSRTRVCVTVGMMTTGYDCQDILNICLMRPIFSPTNFVQMKGRGTRKFKFQYLDLQGKVHKHHKATFKIFDFFANCEFFEEKFNYDEALDLPATAGAMDSVNEDEALAAPVESVEIQTPDRVQHLSEQQVGPEGMRVDREFWSAAHKELSQDPVLMQAVNNERWEDVNQHMRRVYDNKPRLYLTLEKIQQQEALDRRLTWQEVVERIFKHRDRFLTRNELLDVEFNNFIQHYKVDQDCKITNNNSANTVSAIPKALDPHEHASECDNTEEQQHFLMRNFFRSYVGDEDFRKTIDDDDFAELHHSSRFSFEDFKALDTDGQMWKRIVSYVKNYVNLNRFMN